MHHFVLAAVLSSGIVSTFPLLPAARCSDAVDAAQCEAASPKEWTPEERQLVQASLDRLATTDLGRGILEGARANGYRGLQRYRAEVQRNAAGTYETKFGPGFVLYTPKIIGITDAFFELAAVRDARGGYRVGDLVLLHEIVHAFDDRKRSTAEEFTALTGWRLEKGRWQYTNRVSYSAYSGVYAETLTLYARGRYEDAWTRDREFATSLPVAVPRIQSLVTPAETFADVVAHLILDPTAREYLSPALVAWVQKNVFAPRPPALQVRRRAKRYLPVRPHSAASIAIASPCFSAT